MKLSILNKVLKKISGCPDIDPVRKSVNYTIMMGVLLYIEIANGKTIKIGQSCHFKKKFICKERSNFVQHKSISVIILVLL